MNDPKTNPMRKIRIEKIVLNIGCGKDGNIENAKKILESLTGRKAVVTKTHKRTTFGVGRRRPIGVMVTVRKNAKELLMRLVEAVDKKLLVKNFDQFGNFSFGVEEYISVPGMNYDPKIGILGFDVCVTLERPGFSIKRKSLSKKVGKKHRISREEAMDFVRSLGIDIVEKREKEY
ncbi:MAG: 50S ribosomal protein L5 [Candidatus Aenigmarchaeota archaeon]|nr:50S ribosomal protein L5 [Candidatus Aenigmarchaeota archaeon]OYT56446.1 MAG: 50S ribosomal protein L5 [Candidatus Aenigmarchaeota archaeon ex4484_14]